MSKAGNFIQQLLKPFKSDNKEGNKEEELEKKILALDQKRFSFETLTSATKHFHPTHKLGEGGFGPVYKYIDGALVLLFGYIDLKKHMWQYASGASLIGTDKKKGEIG